MPGKKITIFLPDGSPSGLRFAEIGMSTIKAMVIPRASFASAALQPELQKVGIYLLVGADPDRPGEMRVYVGESDAVIHRLKKHLKSEELEFWNAAVVFVLKDENLTKAHVRYLEAKLIRRARRAKRASVANDTNPDPKGMLPEPEAADMDEFIAQVMLLIGTLGYDIFEDVTIPAGKTAQPVSDGQTNAPAEGPVFRAQAEGWDATLRLDQKAGTFVLQRDSIARKTEASSIRPTYRDKRRQLIESGVLVGDPRGYRVAQDYAFDALTAAANVVSGSNNNGHTFWRTAEGKTYREWEAETVNLEPEILILKEGELSVTVTPAATTAANTVTDAAPSGLDGIVSISQSEDA